MPRRFSTVAVLAVASAALTAVVGTGMIVLKASQAAFSSTSSAGPLAFQAGNVALTDDGVGSLYTSVSGLKPGDTATSCIKVSYTGSLPAAVKLYATLANDNGLGAYVDFTVDQGTTGPAASRNCAIAPVFGGTVTGLCSGAAATALPTTYSGGYTAWTANTGDARWYRISYTLDSATPNAQQGNRVDVTLNWQAQS